MRNKLSIITLTYNKLNEATKPFLKSLYASMQNESDFELILVDNGSTDGTVEFLKDFASRKSNVKVIYNSENLGFSKGCNQGADAAQYDYIAFLNNDILLPSGWQDDLFEIFEKEPEAGLISPFQIEGSEYSEWMYPKVSERMFNKRSCDYKLAISSHFSCVMTKKTLFYKIGKFDENFTPAYFEDDDLSWRYLFAGYKNFISQKSYIFHKGSITGKSLPDLKQIFEKNRAYYFQKYADKSFVLAYWFLKSELEYVRARFIKYKNKRLLYKLSMFFKVYFTW